MIGQEIGNYKILEKLGEGGMGVVYKGVDTGLDREVAIKVLTPELANNPELVERFRSEAKAQATLNHTNIATLYAFLQVEGRCLIVMEYLEGQTFEELLLQHGKFPPKDAVSLTRQALLGLGFAHRRGIVHRDIKPSNLMLTSGGIVKVMDFGIAKALTSQTKTRTGVRMGTLPYMSPEQIRSHPVDARSDIYSLGITLYQLLTGILPFRSVSDYELMRQHISDLPQPPTSLAGDVPKGIEQCVLKAISKKPEDRFQSAEKFGAALEHPNGVPIDLLQEGAQPQQAVMPPLVPLAKPEVKPGVIPPPPPPPRPEIKRQEAKPQPQPAPPPAPQSLPRPVVKPPQPISAGKRNAILGVAGGAAVLLLAMLAVAFWPKPQPVPHNYTDGGTLIPPPNVSGASGRNSSGNANQASSIGTGEHGSDDAASQLLNPHAVQPPVQKRPSAQNQPQQNYSRNNLQAVGNTTDPGQPVVAPGTQEFQHALASFNQGQYFLPSTNSALYWDQQAIRAGNSNARALESQLGTKYKEVVLQMYQAGNYSGAMQIVDAMLSYYPQNQGYLSDRQKLLQAENVAASNAARANNYQPPQVPQPQVQQQVQQSQVHPQVQPQPQARAFFVKHRHIELFTNANRRQNFFCIGQLIVGPDGTVAYRCQQSNDPRRGCAQDTVSFVPGTIKEMSMNGNMLHLKTSGGNWDFLPVQDPMATANAYQTINAAAGAHR